MEAATTGHSGQVVARDTPQHAARRVKDLNFARPPHATNTENVQRRMPSRHESGQPPTRLVVMCDAMSWLDRVIVGGGQVQVVKDV
jgi:hypothetical protein